MPGKYLQISDAELTLEYTETEVVTAKLAVGNQVGPGPWSRDNYTCVIGE